MGVFAATAGVNDPTSSGGSGSAGTNVAPTSNSAVQLVNPLKGGATLSSFLSDILKFVIQIGTIAIILMLVFVGYTFVAAQGAPAKIEEAKKMLLWTIIGALVLLGAQAISAAIQATVGALGG